MFSYNGKKIQILSLSSISFLLMVFYEYFWPLVNPLPSPTKWQRFATFLPAIGSFWRSHWSMKLNAPVINIHTLTSFTRRRKRQRSPRVWFQQSWFFTRETWNSELNDRNNSHHFEHLGMENKINQDGEAVYLNLWIWIPMIVGLCQK